MNEHNNKQNVFETYGEYEFLKKTYMKVRSNEVTSSHRFFRCCFKLMTMWDIRMARSDSESLIHRIMDVIVPRNLTPEYKV